MGCSSGVAADSTDMETPVRHSHVLADAAQAQHPVRTPNLLWGRAGAKSKLAEDVARENRALRSSLLLVMASAMASMPTLLTHLDSLGDGWPTIWELPLVEDLCSLGDARVIGSGVSLRTLLVHLPAAPSNGFGELIPFAAWTARVVSDAIALQGPISIDISSAVDPELERMVTAERTWSVLK